MFTTPNYREGYTTDDNARALLVSALLEELGNTDGTDLATRYLAFTWYAFNTETRRFRNFMDYQRNWLEENGSDDSHGRTLWALGTLLGRSSTAALQSTAGRLFDQKGWCDAWRTLEPGTAHPLQRLRAVIDGHSGAEVPFRNVYAEIEAMWPKPA